MKTFSFLKLTFKEFSIKKYIKPNHTQEFYNAKIFQNHQDNVKYRKSHPTQNIFANKPIQNDMKKSSDIVDDQNLHWMYHLNKKRKDMERRINNQMEYAQRTVDSKKLKNSVFQNDITRQLSGGKIDNDTNLVFGVGFDDYILRRAKSKEHVQGSSYKGLDLLISNLGYLDLRDFVALNRYVLEGSRHTDNINQTKVKIISFALEKLSELKKAEVKSHFKKIDQQEKNDMNRIDIKVEYLMENVNEMKEVFYKYYYKLKEMNEGGDYAAMDDFSKFDKLMDSMSGLKAVKKHDLDITIPGVYEKKNQNNFTDYMERIIKTYRDERTIESKTNIESIGIKMDELKLKLNKINEPWHVTMDELTTIAKYYTFFQKYQKIYLPTNIETERLINKYQREKRISDYTFEVMLKEEDANYSSLTDEEDLKNEDIFDEESRNKALNKHEIKMNYFKAKYEYNLKKLEETVDKELADGLGYIMADNVHKKDVEQDVGDWDEIDIGEKPKVMGFMENHINNHYKSFKLDYMYNYMDFFSNKYQVRKKIAEEMKRKVSLKEINYLLNSIVEDENRSYQTKINKITGEKEKIVNNSLNFNIQDVIRGEYGTVRPNFMEIAVDGDSGSPSYNKMRKEAVLSAIKDTEKLTLNLTSEDLYEVELYKGIKNDPFYKHYLHTHLAYTAETMNDVVGGFPLGTRGMKPGDYLKYERFSHIKKSPKTLEKKQNLVASSDTNDLLASVDKSLNSNLEDSKSKINAPKVTRTSYYGFGKRKKCRAYAQLTEGHGVVTINGRPFHNYFTCVATRSKVMLPLILTETQCLYDVKLTLNGGGSNGQAEAALPAISKALIKINEKWGSILAKNFLIKHDSRNVEPKKPGKIKARKGYVYNRR